MRYAVSVLVTCNAIYLPEKALALAMETRCFRYHADLWITSGGVFGPKGPAHCDEGQKPKTSHMGSRGQVGCPPNCSGLSGVNLLHLSPVCGFRHNGRKAQCYSACRSTVPQSAYTLYMRQILKHFIPWSTMLPTVTVRRISCTDFSQVFCPLEKSFSDC